MRRTYLTTEAGDRLTVTTGDRGTEVLDREGRVVAEYGTDRHDEQVALRQDDGWRVEEDGTARPTEAGPPGPPADPGGPEAGPDSLVDIGLTS